MNYDSIILEMLSRIKALEEDVKLLMIQKSSYTEEERIHNEKEAARTLPTTDDFKSYIIDLIDNMESDYIDVRAGDVHLECGGGYGNDVRITSCCNAMRSLMEENLGDMVLPNGPKSGNGMNYVVRYYKR